jgi:hypothetical protein
MWCDRVRSARSGSSRASSAIRWSFVETSTGLGVPAILPSNDSMSRRPPSLHGVPRSGSPASQVLPRRYDLLTPLPPRFVSFAWRYRTLSSRFAPAVGRTVATAGQGSFLPAALTTGSLVRRRQDLPGSWATPVDGRHALGPRTDPRARPFSAQGCCRRSSEQRRLRRIASFRGSITRLPYSLSMLRGLGRPRNLAQDSLPAGGQPLPGRILTCQVRSRRFQCLSSRCYISPSSRFLLARSG